jgi:hypothetical protein
LGRGEEEERGGGGGGEKQDRGASRRGAGERMTDEVEVVTCRNEDVKEKIIKSKRRLSFIDMLLLAMDVSHLGLWCTLD